VDALAEDSRTAAFIRSGPDDGTAGDNLDHTATKGVFVPMMCVVQCVHAAIGAKDGNLCVEQLGKGFSRFWKTGGGGTEYGVAVDNPV